MGPHSATSLITLQTVAVMWRIHVCETLIGLIVENNTGSVVIYQDERRQKNFTLCYYSVVHSTKGTSGLQLSGCILCSFILSVDYRQAFPCKLFANCTESFSLSLAKMERKYLTATYSEANQTHTNQLLVWVALDWIITLCGAQTIQDTFSIKSILGYIDLQAL